MCQQIWHHSDSDPGLLNRHRNAISQPHTVDVIDWLPRLDPQPHSDIRSSRQLFTAQHPGAWNHAALTHLLTKGRDARLHIHFGSPDIGTAAATTLQHPAAHQRINGLTNRHARDTETLGKLALTRHDISDRQAGVDKLDEVVPHGHVFHV